MTDNNFRLLTLGRPALIHPDGHEDESLGKRRRKLAVLAVLAVARRPFTRDALAEMFWGDQEEAKAKHSLSDVLSNLRRVISPDCVVTNQQRVELSSHAPLTVDANELTAAAAKSRWSQVVELYRGEFLEGVTVPGSQSFDAWVTVERERLRQLFLRACARRVEILTEDELWEECAAVAQRWLAADPFSADAALALLGARQHQGTHEALQKGVAEYEQLNAQLIREHDAEADNRVAALAAILAREAERAAPVARARKLPEPTGATGAAPPRWRSAVPATLAAFAIVVIGGLAWLSRPPQPVRAAIAIVDIKSLQGDSADAWLEQGLPQMIAADLSQTTGIEVIAPERVREIRLRAISPSEQKPLSVPQLLNIAKGVGATTVVSGGLSRGNGNYVLDLTVHDARTGDVVKLFTVSDTSLIGLADAAAARLAGAARVGDGPQFADIETPNVQAYQHYVRSLQESSVGRYNESTRELDAAIALDSGLVPALRARISLAQSVADTAIARKVWDALVRHPQRGSEYDRMAIEILRAQMLGERTRTLALARALVRKYPRDPQALRQYAEVLSQQGYFEATDSVYRAALALDSLGIEVGVGPCAPCTGYGGLAQLKQFLGDLPAAEKLARRWIALQPDAPIPWGLLSDVLRYEQRYPEAVDAYRRAFSLSGDRAYFVNMPRVYLEARRYEAVDSALAVLSKDPDRRIDVLDMRIMLQRELGQYRASARTGQQAPGDQALMYVAANSLARIGDYGVARAIYETTAHAAQHKELAPGIAPNDARQFSWGHALEADAIAPAGDTIILRAFADSIERISNRSWYARDWRLHHHVLGLIAMQQHRYRDAIREFQQARWGAAGWTSTVAHIAEAYMALGQPKEAVRILRDAYKGPLDAMGRYQPRSELNYQMALAFQRAGQADSARTYASYVRTAWQAADPEVKARLALLPN